MRESIKVVCVVVLMVASVTGAVAWMDEPGMTVLRIASPAIALLALAVFLRMHFRRDIEVDYLRELGGTYFNRSGLCFVPMITSNDGRTYLSVYFQNQYERPCHGRVSVRPARGFWMNRPNISPATFEIECGPGGFGFARQAIAIPRDIQGKTLPFEVGACAEYPQGRGRQLRFHDGILIRTTLDFSNSARALSVISLLVGIIYLSKPATAKLALPTDVSDQPPSDSTTTVVVLRQVGEPPVGVGA